MAGLFNSFIWWWLIISFKIWNSLAILCFCWYDIQLVFQGKINKPPVLTGIEGTDVTISKHAFRVGPQIGAGGFGLIFLGLPLCISSHRCTCHNCLWKSKILIYLVLSILAKVNPLTRFSDVTQSSRQGWVCLCESIELESFPAWFEFQQVYSEWGRDLAGFFLPLSLSSFNSSDFCFVIWSTLLAESTPFSILSTRLVTLIELT